MENLKKSKKITILRGGISDEKKISIQTANQVFEILKTKYEVTIINVDENCEKLLLDLRNCNPDVVFNCLHGFFGEDGQVQSILNYLKIPYTHSGVLASSIAMNKVISKFFYNAVNVSHPKTINMAEIETNFKGPIIIKPICGGSSKGLYKIENSDQLTKFKEENKEQISNFFVEEFIEGRELTVGILDNKICGIMEMIYDSNLYDFDSKYVNIAKHILNPKIPKEIEKKLRETSLKIHKTLNCNCISRLDFKYDAKYKEIFLLEINTQPGLTKNSLLPEMAKDLGIDFIELCEIILSKAKCEII